MNRTELFGIYENGVFTNIFAVTSFEAQEWCLRIAKEFTETLVGERINPGILWCGQLPQESSICLVYANPGPDKTRLNVVRCTKNRGWLGSEWWESVVLKSYEIKSIIRASPKPKSVASNNNVIVYEVIENKRVREVREGSSFDNLLVEIRSRANKTVERTVSGDI